jgi:hypothetical protein
MPEAPFTERQERWFESLRSGLERDTRKSLEAWVAIARTCPETAHRARLKWFKTEHGLLQNRASLVLSEAFPSRADAEDPEAALAGLWRDPPSRALFEALDAEAQTHPGVVRTTRKTYCAWSRRVQFLALRPLPGGRAMMGLAIGPDAASGLEPPRSESWSERLKSRLILERVDDIHFALRALIARAYDGA